MNFNKLPLLFLSSFVLNSVLSSMANNSEPKLSEVWSREVPFSEIEKNCIYNVEHDLEFDQSKAGDRGYQLEYSYLTGPSFKAFVQKKLNKNLSSADISELMKSLDTIIHDVPAINDKIKYNVESYLAGWLKKDLWYKPVDLLAKNVFGSQNYTNPVNTAQEEQRAKQELSDIKKAKICLVSIYALLASGCVVGAYKLIQYFKNKINRVPKKKNRIKNISKN